jgi:hypothetical protein
MIFSPQKYVMDGNRKSSSLQYTCVLGAVIIWLPGRATTRVPAQLRTTHAPTILRCVLPVYSRGERGEDEVGWALVVARLEPFEEHWPSWLYEVRMWEGPQMGDHKGPPRATPPPSPLRDSPTFCRSGCFHLMRVGGPLQLLVWSHWAGSLPLARTKRYSPRLFSSNT